MDITILLIFLHNYLYYKHFLLRIFNFSNKHSSTVQIPHDQFELKLYNNFKRKTVLKVLSNEKEGCCKEVSNG
jgi:hypothetical protein